MSSSIQSRKPLGFDPESLPRENKRHYISASDSDISEMLKTVGVTGFGDLYKHIPNDSKFAEAPDLPEELSIQDTVNRLEDLADKNNVRESFIGDALPHYKVMEVVDPVCQIRNLTTAYTPYQPERSQGTLMTHWIYQCLMSQITGFEAINSSLYERSTAIFESMATAVRVSRKGDTILLSEGLFPCDREVIETLAVGTGIKMKWIPLQQNSGLSDIEAFQNSINELGETLAGIVFPHVNCLGLLEDVDTLTDLVSDSKVKAIAVIDPALLGSGGLKAPVEFGSKGADMIVGEAQHLAIGPNFGGPGLGLFGVRHNAADKNTIRQTPGRYVGQAQDDKGRECLVMVLSTREQHIRKDKATSNICSNQAFLATIAGAALLERGESGMRNCFSEGHRQAVEAASLLTQFEGFKLAFPDAPIVNECTIEINTDVPALIKQASEAGIHLGVDVSDRIKGNRNLLKLSFSDRPVDLNKLSSFLESAGYPKSVPVETVLTELPLSALRKDPLNLPEFPKEEIIEWYGKLGELNVSPDDGCYPLGSCTMKYNPYLNDWAASLEGFTDIHPQAPISDAQGCLELLYETQEWFKKITGLAGVTTQPVAGAQGELVGIKMFQAYHKANGDENRDVILIPGSAHGTNFATAVMAGFHKGKFNGLPTGIVLLEANPDGTIDMNDLKSKIDTYQERIAGIMITNPNTSGVFENTFKEISDLIHDAGGLVYMDGANMNAIAGWCDLGAMGVDAVHNNLHKTWTIPHGGGGPGDAIVAVSEKLVPFLPGYQIEKSGESFKPVRASQSIGSFHRHWGNFAHKVRAYSYLLRLGKEGVPKMTAMAVLSARYCFEKLKINYPTLPAEADAVPRMHEFILTLSEDDFNALESAGIPKALAVTRVGKLFLDFGFHAPTVAWPEAFGLMIEPTESYSKAELDRFCEAVSAIIKMVREHPEVLKNVPFFTPVDRVDEVSANRQLCLNKSFSTLPEIIPNRVNPADLAQLPVDVIYQRILEASGSAN